MQADRDKQPVSDQRAFAESYQYDALGRRISTSNSAGIVYYLHDGIHVIAEADAAGSLTRSYTWGPGVDNLLAFTTGYGTASTNSYFAIKDHLGTVHAVADENGDIVESYRFDAWGRVVGVYDGDGAPIAQSAVGNRYLLQGREYSWATGLYYFRARWYDPVTGRWLSNDPIGISGGLNEYSGFAGDPVHLVDPDGLDPITAVTLGVLFCVTHKVGQVAHTHRDVDYDPDDAYARTRGYETLYGPSYRQQHPLVREAIRIHEGVHVGQTFRFPEGRAESPAYGAEYDFLDERAAALARKIRRLRRAAGQEPDNKAIRKALEKAERDYGAVRRFMDQETIPMMKEYGGW